MEINKEKLAKVLESLHSQPDVDAVIAEMHAGVIDFEINGVRFVHSEHIDRIQQNDLLSDLYVLGCFNADFLSPIIGIEAKTITRIQEADAYEGIGEIAAKHIEEVQKRYAEYDGYGHHFNHYDFSQEEFGDYYIFDNRN